MARVFWNPYESHLIPLAQNSKGKLTLQEQVENRRLPSALLGLRSCRYANINWFINSICWSDITTPCYEKWVTPNKKVGDPFLVTAPAFTPSPIRSPYTYVVNPIIKALPCRRISLFMINIWKKGTLRMSPRMIMGEVPVALVAPIQGNPCTFPAFSCV